MTAPYRPKAEYGIIVLIGGLVLALGMGVAVARYVAGPSASPSPSASPRPAASVAASTPVPDATTSWTAYADTADDFSLRYPPAWEQLTCAVSGHTTLYLAPSTATLGSCNSGFEGQMYIGVAGGDQRAAYTWAASGGYSSVASQSVMVGGVSALRQTATVPESAAAGPVPGSKMVHYVLYSAGLCTLPFTPKAQGLPIP